MYFSPNLALATFLISRGQCHLVIDKKASGGKKKSHAEADSKAWKAMEATKPEIVSFPACLFLQPFSWQRIQLYSQSWQ